MGVVPLLAGRLAPLVVVGGEAAHPHHRVHRRRAAEHLASRPIDLAPVELLLRLGPIVPVHLAADQLREARGDVDELVLVLRPGFEHHDLNGLIRAEAIGHHRSGRARSHDDVVGIHPPESRSPATSVQSVCPATMRANLFGHSSVPGWKERKSTPLNCVDARGSNPATSSTPEAPRTSEPSDGTPATPRNPSATAPPDTPMAPPPRHPRFHLLPTVFTPLPASPGPPHLGAPPQAASSLRSITGSGARRLSLWPSSPPVLVSS